MASKTPLDDDSAADTPSTSPSPPPDTSLLSPRSPAMAHAATPAPLQISTQVANAADVRSDLFANRSPYSSPSATDGKGKHSAPMISTPPGIASKLKDLNQSGLLSDTKDQRLSEYEEKMKAGMEKDRIEMHKRFEDANWNHARLRDVEEENEKLKKRLQDQSTDLNVEITARKTKGVRLRALEANFNAAQTALEQSDTSAKRASQKHAEDLKAAKNELATLIQTCRKCTKELQAAKTEIGELRQQKEVLAQRAEKLVPLTLDNNRLEAQVARLEDEINATLTELDRLAEVPSETPQDVFADDDQPPLLESAPISARSAHFAPLDLPTPSSIRSFATMPNTPRGSIVVESRPGTAFTSYPVGQSFSIQRMASIDKFPQTEHQLQDDGVTQTDLETDVVKGRQDSAFEALSFAQACPVGEKRTVFRELGPPSAAAQGTHTDLPSLPQLFTRSSIQSVYTEPQAPSYHEKEAQTDPPKPRPENTDKDTQKNLPEPAPLAYKTKATQIDPPPPPARALARPESDFPPLPSPQHFLPRTAPHPSPPSPLHPPSQKPKHILDPLLYPTLAFTLVLLAMTCCMLLALNERAVWRAANETTRKAFWLFGEGLAVGEPRWVAKMQFVMQQVLGVERGCVG
ncbi:MAG: hypothetical protein Q9160_000728 [Pyrenula sp. 1 TL-2023]